MIVVLQSREEFAYDIHSLMKAFYPKEEVRVLTPQTKKSEPSKNRDETSVLLNISIDYEENRIRSQICHGDGSFLGEEEIRRPADCSRKSERNYLKTLLYHQLSALTGQNLPWGNLTGIRPTKIPMDLLNDGWPSVDIIQTMQEKYFVSASKADLAFRIARLEKRLLDAIPYRQGYSLYIGIPFCPSICLYCSFSSSPLHLWKDKVDAYLDALIREMEACAHLFDGYELQSVYFGGGTPTTLEPAQMDRLLTALERNYDLSKVKEITVEAGRPDTINRDILHVLKCHPVTRISINPQTMNQQTLDRIGRAHTVEEIKEAFAAAREMGFHNINMDTIVGLPGEGPEEVRHTMEELMLLHPDSITVHSLALKRSSRLRLALEEYEDTAFQNSSSIMEMTQRICMDNGMNPYYLYRQKNIAGNFENVGYALPGKEGLYNILIMEEVQSILALGAGASTKLVEGNGLIERIENVKNVSQYIDRIDEMIQRKQCIPNKMMMEEKNG